MLAFLDSSILCADFYMRGTYFELLKRAVGVHIILAEVVVDEVRNKHKQMVKTYANTVNKSVKDLNRVINSSIQMVNDSFILDEEKKYADFIDMFLIESGSTIAEPYPKVEHEEIVRRALARRKPFKSDGKDGYRDFLVWKTFLETTKTYAMETVCFITLNKKDFSDQKDESLLHPDLLADIEEAGIDKDRVQYWTSLKDFLDKIVIPEMNQMEEREKFTNSLLSDHAGFVRPLEEMMISELTGTDLSGYDVLVVGESPTLSNIDEIYTTEIQNATMVSDTEYLLEIHFDTICLIDSCVLKTELAAIVKDEPEDLVITKINYNDHYALAETHIGLKIDVEVIFNIDKKEFSSFDVSYISDYSCIYCD